MKASLRVLALALALGTVLSVACASSDDAPCERNSDCELAYCLEGVCRKDCVDSALDCPRGYACSAIGRCEFDGTSGAGGTDTAGASGTTSAAGTGGKSGAGAGGSTSGAAGMSGISGHSGADQAGTGGSAGTSGAAGATGPGGAAGVAGVSGISGQSGAAGDPFGGGGTAGGTGTAIELDACASDGDCTDGLLCRAPYKNGPTSCTHACASNADCPGGRRCETIDGASVCTPGDIGRTCTTADMCNFGCLTPQNYCTSTCVTGADCPNGYGCTPVGTPATRVCTRLNAVCDAQDTSACIAPAACDTSTKMVVSGCTTACNSAADCPQRAAGLPPWTCDGLCRRPSDVVGPLEGGSPAEYACGASSQVVNVCNDGQHINFDAFTIPPSPSVNCASPVTTPGQPGDACVDSCRFQGGCAWNFSCTAVGNINNNRIGLCLPQGSKPVGAPCTGGTECAFGYCLASPQVCSRDCTADGLCPTGSTCTAAGGPSAEGKPFRRCM